MLKKILIEVFNQIIWIPIIMGFCFLVYLIDWIFVERSLKVTHYTVIAYNIWIPTILIIEIILLFFTHHKLKAISHYSENFKELCIWLIGIFFPMFWIGILFFNLLEPPTFYQKIYRIKGTIEKYQSKDSVIINIDGYSKKIDYFNVGRAKNDSVNVVIRRGLFGIGVINNITYEPDSVLIQTPH